MIEENNHPLDNNSYNAVMIEVENVSYSLDTFCSDMEDALPRWNHFAERFDKDRRIMMTFRNRRLFVMFNMAITPLLGVYADGNWDIFCPDGGGNTVGFYINKRQEEGNVAPLMIVLGIDDSIPQEIVDQVKREVKYLKLVA